MRMEMETGWTGSSMEVDVRLGLVWGPCKGWNGRPGGTGRGKGEALWYEGKKRRGIGMGVECPIPNFLVSWLRAVSFVFSSHDVSVHLFSF